MRARRFIRRPRVLAAICAPALAIAGLALTAGPAAAVPAHVASHPVVFLPHRGDNVDCNQWSSKYSDLTMGIHRALCTDPISLRKYTYDGRTYYRAWRFSDNGHYVGHDEPSTKFISSTPGSGNTMTWYLRLPVDPKRAPNASGSITHYNELTPAIWFGLPMCDPDSYPLNPCTPDSDSNKGAITNPADAGSAFMELQFYAPGNTPFIENDSCLAKQWCGALTIDSLESQFAFKNLNPNCEEPSNFAYLQRNGVPTGPPNPQQTDVSTFTPNAQTLRMNGGDVLKISITDPASGFTTTVTDLTTGQTGTMQASAANHFGNTNPKTCAGKPFTFHAEYSTAKKQNQVPWAALEGGVLAEQETGHFESCQSLAARDPFSASFGNGQSFLDTHAYDVCIGGGSEGRHKHGEGPCNVKTGVCKHSTTEGKHGPIACPKPNWIKNGEGQGELCEFADGICFKAGSRTVTQNGVQVKETQSVTGCLANRFQNGDLDFDGTPYQARSWDHGTKNTPTAPEWIGPFMANGKPYPQVQFETDIAGSEFQCNTSTGHNCLAPPLAAKFYPYWSLSNVQRLKGVKTPSAACVWDFGSFIPGVTKHDFGKDAQYGVSDTARYGGTLTSKVMANPEFNGTLNCPSFTNPGG